MEEEDGEGLGEFGELGRKKIVVFLFDEGDKQNLIFLSLDINLT